MAADDDHSVGTREPRHRLRQRFEVIRKLGHGTYGKVQLAVNKETGQEVAIKTIKKAKIENGQDLVRIRREIQIMSYVQHPHIIHIHEVFENKEKIVLVMQYASGGELYDYLKTRRGASEADSRRIFRQIVSAVYYCHKNKICHRDLKLENILLDERGNAKIADFGLSNVFSDDKFLHTFCGSPLYASPEIVKGKPYYGPEVDCWSLGVLLYTLIYGAMPFDGSNFRSLVRQISEGDYYEPKRKSDASGLIQHLLTVKPAKRATVADICEHWWVNLGYEHPLSQVAEDMANFSPINVDAFLNLPQTNRSEQCKSPRKQDSSRSADSPITGQSSLSQEINEGKATKLTTNCHLNYTNYDVVNSDSVSCSEDSLIINSIGPSKETGVESNIFPNDCFHSVPDKNTVSKFGAKLPGKGLSTNNQDKKKHIPQSEFSITANKLTTEEISSTKKSLVTDERLCSPEILNKSYMKEGKVAHHKESTDVIINQETYRKEPIVGMCKVKLASGEKLERFRPPSSTEKFCLQEQSKNKTCEKKIIVSRNDEHTNQRDAQTTSSKDNPLSRNENKAFEMSQSHVNTTKVSDNSISIHVEKSKLCEGKLTDQPAIKSETVIENKAIKFTGICISQENIQSLEKTTLPRDNDLSSSKNNELSEVCQSSASTLKSSDSSIYTWVNKSIPDEEKLINEETKVKKNETKEEKVKDSNDDKKSTCKKGPGKLVIPKFFEVAQAVEKPVDNKKINKSLWSVSDAKKAFENKQQEKKPIYIPTRRVSDARSKFEQKIESNHVSTLPRRASKHNNALKEDLSICSLSSLKYTQRQGSELDGISLKNNSESDMPKSSCIQNSCEESNTMQTHHLPGKELKGENSNDDQAKKTSVKQDINEIPSFGGNRIATDNPNKNLSAVSSFCEDKSSRSQNKTDISEKEALETVTEVSSSSVDLESFPITQNHNSSIRPSEQNSSTEEAKQVTCQSKNVIDEMEEQQHKCNFHEGTISVIQTLPYDNIETSKENKNIEKNLSENAQEIKIATSNSLTDKPDHYAPDKEKTTSNDYHKEQTDEDNLNNVQTISNDSGNCSDNEIRPPSKAQTIHDQSSGYISENQSLVGGEEQDVNEGTKLDLLKTFMEQECYPLNALLQNGYDQSQEAPNNTHQKPSFLDTIPLNNDKELGMNNLPLQTRKPHQPRRRHSDAQSSDNQSTFGLRDISDLPESCYNDMLRFLNSRDTIRPKCSVPSVFSKHRHTRHITNKDHQARIQHWVKSEQRNGHSTDKDSSDNDDDFDIHLEYSYPAVSDSNANENNVEDTLVPIQYSTQLPAASRPISHTGYRLADEFSSVSNYKCSALSNEEVENLIGIPSRNMNYIRRHSHTMRYKDPFQTDITSRYMQNPTFQSLLPGCYHSNTLHDHLKTRPNVAELYGTLRRRSSCKSDILEFPEQRDSFYSSSSISRKALHSKQSSSFGRDTANTERIRRNYTRSLSLDIPDVPQHSARIICETNLQKHIPQDYTQHPIEKQIPSCLHVEENHSYENNVTDNYQTSVNSNPSQNCHSINSEPNQKFSGETKISEDIMQHEINKLETDVKDSCSPRKPSESVELMVKPEYSLLQQVKRDGHVGSISDQNLSSHNKQPENTLLSSVQTEPIAHKSTSLSLLEALKMQGYKNVIAQNMNFGSSATDFDKSRTINGQEHLRNLQNCESQERFREQKTINDTSLSSEHPNLTFPNKNNYEFPQYENLAFQQSNSKPQLATVRESNESLSCKFESDQEESVSERIWRKSFYSRFNDSLAKRRKSYREGDLKTQSISGSNWDILMEDNFKDDILSRRRSSLTLGSSYSSTLPRSGIKPITKQRSCGSEVSDPLFQINDSSMIHKSSYRQKCNKNNRASSLELVESVSEDSSSFPVQRPAHSIATDRDLLYTTSIAESSYNRLYGTLKSSAYNSNSRQFLSQLREGEDCRSGKNMGSILPRRRYSTFDGYLYLQKTPTLTEPVISLLDSTKAENDEFS